MGLGGQLSIIWACPGWLIMTSTGWMIGPCHTCRPVIYGILVPLPTSTLRTTTLHTTTSLSRRCHKIATAYGTSYDKRPPLVLAC